MANKLRVGLIFGGRSGEHEVSLMSARSVLSAIDPEKYEITQIGISHDGAWLVGEDVLDALELGHLDIVALGSALARSHSQRHIRHSIQRGRASCSTTSLSWMWSSRCCTAPLAKMARLQGLLELADLAYVGAGVLGSSLGMDKAVFKSVMRAHGIPVVDWIVVTRSGNPAGCPCSH